jgi:Zn finger protein HypA/HybF involved in hydrogenase expression
MELVTLKTFDNAIDVHILRSRLESEGITCFIFDEHIVSVNPLYNIGVGGIKLKVRADELQLALQVLRDISDTPYTDEENNVVSCPKCKSTNVTSGFKSMKGIAGFFTMVVSFLLTVFPIYARSTYRCNECDHEFQRRKEP